MSNDKTLGWVPPHPARGPELTALDRFFRDCTWTGSIEANGMGPGSPAMTARGGGVCRWIMDGLWLACDFMQDQYAGGRHVLTWRLHLVVGWNSVAREYHAVMVDSNGTAATLTGRVDGDTLTMAPVGAMTMGGQPVQFRFVWNAANAAALTWRNEYSLDGKTWGLIEEYVMTANRAAGASTTSGGEQTSDRPPRD